VRQDGSVQARHAYIDGDHELTIRMSRVNDSVAEEFLQGEAEFGLVVEEPAVVLCYRFGKALGWGSVVCDPEARRPTLDGPQARALLHAALIDDASGKVRAERNWTLSLDLTRRLDESLTEAARVSFDPTARSRALASLHRRCPTPAALAARALARCVGSA
jgi:hypothetical protein